ncbi:protein of unknown function [Taphrina deformans PYCC 5710]|uniref:Glycosyl hydrolase family 13 catalytic domain-containing protein n=1 Tax=Taphrina deformans (strain PYCC 5710 / ATCC 11124 / CBS 356.35 / IMI 108563 / JCM 9778 / NBRC 8474) TaxID=1097556 RepID=R4XE65_TAPDE|nr:protein of unknown function [Taphrina deformans PYCC 5710]|eukprot:CCG84095.1 protein of unknown function [Taphrina deformans PYCC 5710]
MTSQWWKDATVYQIYPASFQDSDGDGIGDIPGITSRLDYLKDLGIDVIWISPFFDSPQIDMGYDISDYENVYPPYGTVKDVEECISECHKRGIKIIFDLVVNHTSDMHKWFQDSRSSKDSPKRDWYIWRPAKYVNGKRCPPNNWRAHFGGSVWQWDEQTEEYYLHYFCPEQPDLNWESPACREAIYDSAMRFWLDKGCDGFRIDTVNMYSKHLDFPDAPIDDPDAEFQFAREYYSHGPRLHEFLSEMNEKVLSKYNCMTVGECPNVRSKEQLLSFVGASQKKLNMVFEFELAEIDIGDGPNYKLPKAWRLSQIKEIIARSQSYLDGGDGWVTNYLENHDRSRVVSRFGDDSPEFRVQSAKMLAILLNSLSGTNFIHQGGEIGMINAPRDWPIEEYRDVDSRNWHAEHLAKDRGEVYMQQIMAGLRLLSRDHGRLPMQWSNTAQAGFTTGTPWTRVHDDFPSLNVDLQKVDESSVYHFYRTLLTLRKQKRALRAGLFQMLEPDNQQTMVYLKSFEEEVLLVALNWTSDRQTYHVPENASGQWRRLIGNGIGAKGVLEPYEAVIYEHVVIS